MDAVAKDKLTSRLSRISAIDGWGMTILSGICVLVSVSIQDIFGALVSLLIFTAGLLELSGRSRLNRGIPRKALRLMPASQLLVLLTIIVYCIFQICMISEEDLSEVVDQVWPLLSASIVQLQYNKQTLTELIYDMSNMFFALIVFISLIYQGSMFVYYRSCLLKIIAYDELEESSHTH